MNINAIMWIADKFAVGSVSDDSLRAAIEQYANQAREEMRKECAKVCRSQVDLRGASDDHKYMADKCALDIEAIK